MLELYGLLSYYYDTIDNTDTLFPFLVSVVHLVRAELVRRDDKAFFYMLAYFFIIGMPYNLKILPFHPHPHFLPLKHYTSTKYKSEGCGEGRFRLSLLFCT